MTGILATAEAGPAGAGPDAPDRTRQLAEFACGPLDRVPDVVRLRVKHCLLDFFGVCLHAAQDGGELLLPLESLLAVAGGHGDCTVIGRGAGYSVEMAALSNGVLAHCFDFDDTNVPGLLHQGAPVIPAILALAEQEGVDGTTILHALSVGYEVGARVGAALGETAYDRGFHITSVAGVFGATAGAGIVAGLDVDALIGAWGFAGSQAAGSMQYLVTGSSNKRFHPGFAARAAVDSVALVRGGAIGSSQAIDGRWGLLTGYSSHPEPRRLTEGLGTRWLTEHTGIKPYPSCRFAHGAIDAALAVRDQLPGAALRADELPRVDVRLSPRAYQVVGERQPNKVRPETLVDGQFSAYFQVAEALLQGVVTPASYTHLQSPDTQRLMEHVHVTAASGLQGLAAEVSVTAPDGTLLAASLCEQPAGEPPDGITEQVVRRKFDELSRPVLGQAGIERLAAAVGDLEGVADARQLLGLLTPGRD